MIGSPTGPVAPRQCCLFPLACSPIQSVTAKPGSCHGTTDPVLYVAALVTNPADDILRGWPQNGFWHSAEPTV